MSHFVGMHIGSVTITLAIPGSQSLKDKRHVIRGLLDAIRGKFNVSAAEVGELDLWQRATIAVVTVANEAAFVDQVLAKVLDLVESDPGCTVLEIDQERL